MTDSPKITQEMINLYDEYTHITLDRRAYLGKLTALVGSTAAAIAVTSLIEADKASAEIVKADDAQPVFIPPHSGKVLDFLAITHKLTSQQTGGACCLFESVFDPETGNRLHVHGREDEIAYVLEGALEVRFSGRKTRSLDAGGGVRLGGWFQGRDASRAASAIASLRLPKWP